MRPLDRLRSQSNVIEVDLEGAVAFTETAEAGVLLLPGDPARPEVTDLAVVLGELSSRFPLLRVAVAGEGDEAQLKARFAVTKFPALLFVKDGAVKTTLARMQSWSTYEGAARALGEPS